MSSRANKPLPPGTQPEGIESQAAAADYIRQMFTRVAPRYDFLNHLLSFWLDRSWRRRAAEIMRARLAKPNTHALDLCCGTGELALELARRTPGLVVGNDFCHPMLERAVTKSRRNHLRLAVVEADALRLPFADATFDVVTAAFGFRNLANYAQGLAEIHRVLKPGGIVGILEFALPARGLFGQLYRFYFQRVLPWVGNTLSGRAEAYDYLPASVEKFPNCEGFAAWLRAAGFANVTYTRWTGGIVALHQGEKTPQGKAEALHCGGR